MNNFFKYLIIFVFILKYSLIAQNKIELDGKWHFAVDPDDKGLKEQWYKTTLNDNISLPGSMTTNGKGYDISLSTKWTGDILDSSFFKDDRYEKYRSQENFKVPFWLQPDKTYYGKAWYQKEINIPEDWTNKTIELYLERCHWQSALWFDDIFIAEQNSLGAPHIFDLTGKIKSGKHKITISIDNRINEINPGVNSSSLTDHSQTNWNGIVGKMYISAKGKIHISKVRIFTDIKSKFATSELEIKNDLKEKAKIKISITPSLINHKINIEPYKTIVQEFEIESGNNIVNFDYEFGNQALLWDEFNPNLYKMNFILTSDQIEDQKEEIFGFRKLESKGIQFFLNDKAISLRGTLECAIFPKTGYPSTDVNEWTRIFKKIKEYGLNHMRFHSWCPPEAAFTAADNVGVYLHVECSSWANQGSSLGDGKGIDKYIQEESERIIEAYGNHPSFCFLVYGNEPGGEFHQKYLTDFVTHWKNKDNRRLYSSAAGWPQLNENDFHSMYEPRIQLWGAGLSSIINSQPPSSNFDWYNIISWRGKPVISHEIGQWCVYPNFDEITKYDGVLKAKNFEIFQETLSDNNLSELADSFLIASGKLQVLCYKHEIEAALRTKNMGGFQLLDLHDFPGQGTALVGVLDPFWEEKGYVTANEYTKFCNATVPLVRFSKFIFNSKERLKIPVEIYHFGNETIKEAIPYWFIKDASGKTILEGKLSKADIGIGNTIPLGEISFDLSEFKTPAMYTLTVKVDQFTNDWDFWVYPYENPNSIFNSEIKIVNELDESTINYLNNGGMVLFTPTKGSIKNSKGGDIAVGFSSIFWNTAWTNKQAPHTLGILCNPQHPVFDNFPTQFHSNYQWWDAMSHSNAIILNELGENIKPIVRIIDDWFTNRSLGLLIECKVGNGKMIISGIDLLTDSEKRSEARQLTYSIVEYMKSEKFNPTQEVDVKKVIELVK